MPETIDNQQLFRDLLDRAVRTWDPDRHADAADGPALQLFYERLDDLYEDARKFLHADHERAVRIVREGSAAMIQIAAAAKRD